MKLKIYNTLSRKIEVFSPIEERKVRLYTCGPTVYNYPHIGNLRTYLFEDILRRTLDCAGYEVRHVMNITDVGHLESDADLGEDKMMLASERENKSPWELARFYENAFFDDCAALNILPPHLRCRATEHIDAIIEFVKDLERLDYAYNVEGNIYFDIGKYPSYAELARLRLDQLQEGARVEVDPRKRNPLDFVLWFSHSKYPHQIMKWNSPWGVGFPGWHIECSVIASKYLGERIDIHCGGIDHIPLHHTNERAQSEARFGHPWVNAWMHGEFLLMEDEKMSKSKERFVTLKTLVDQGFEAVHYRYFCLGARYRQPLRFSWDALRTARNSFESLKNRAISWKLFPSKSDDKTNEEEYRCRFWDAIADDLNTPTALAVLWDAAKSTTLSSRPKFKLLLEFDRVLGLGASEFQRPKLSREYEALIKLREEARKKKDWKTADILRNQLREAGIQIKDTPEGPNWYIVYDD
jgi:cysteinyl-tRNA synthetase